MNTWDRVRADYPVFDTGTYFFTNGGGPVGTPLVKKATALFTELSEKGRGVLPAWDNQANDVRSLLAGMIRAQASEIAFITNTAQGMSLLYGMFPASYEIITMRDEFPTSFVGWMHSGHTVHLVDSHAGEISIADIEAKITPATRILITSHVMFRTGFRQNLQAIGELCKAHGLIHVVDATQSFGVTDIDVQACHIDILIFHGYKWVTSGYGSGAMYVSQRILDQYPPQVISWCSVDYESADFQSVNDYTRFTPKKDARVLEPGTLPYMNILLLGEALQYLQRIGIPDISAYVQQLIAYLHEQAAANHIRLLTSYAPDHRSAIQVMEVTPEQYKKVEQKNIQARYKNGKLTIALNFYNNRADIDLLFSALREG